MCLRPISPKLTWIDRLASKLYPNHLQDASDQDICSQHTRKTLVTPVVQFSSSQTSGNWAREFEYRSNSWEVCSHVVLKQVWTNDYNSASDKNAFTPKSYVIKLDRKMGHAHAHDMLNISSFTHLCVSAMISRRAAGSTSLLLKLKAAVREVTTSRKAFSPSGDNDEELPEGPASSASTVAGE